MNIKRVIVALVALVILAATAGAAPSETTVKDQAGYTVTISHPVTAIASVYGIGTYTVYALGGEDHLVRGYYVGVKTLASASELFLRWEPRLPDILGFGDPNVEELVALETQLVLADASRHEAVADQLRDLGIPVVLYHVESTEALKTSVALTGRLLGPEAEAKAAAWIDDYERIIDHIEADTAGISSSERIRVLFLGTSPNKVASGEMYQSELIEAAGGISVTEGLQGGWNEVNLEQILLWDPDLIVIPPYGPVQPTDLLDNPDWQAIAAVKSGRVIRMPRLIAPMDTPVPESIVGLAWLAKTFYPDRVSLDLEAEVSRFYGEYYRFVLTDDEIGRLAN